MWSYFLVYKEKDKITLIPFKSMKKMMKYCDIYDSKRFSQYIIKYWCLGYSVIKSLPSLRDPKVRKTYNL